MMRYRAATVRERVLSRAARIGLAAAGLALLASAQSFSDLKFEVLAKGYRFTKGVAWSNKDGYLIFSDTPSDRLLKWVPGNEIEVFRSGAHGPSGNAFDALGRLYTCETRTRSVTRTDKNGKVDTLADKWEGKRFNAPNDIAVTKTGQVYFTDPAFGEQSDHRELDFYGVYHIPLKGPVTLVAKSTTGRPNGIALSPNGRTLYVGNSDEHNVRAYDLDAKGEASGERVLASNIEGAPMGMCVDEKGNLFVTAKGIAIFNPQGKRLHLIEMHELASNCVFGEADLKGLIVTARGLIYRVRPEVKPEAK
jgi:gluconolactonase